MPKIDNYCMYFDIPEQPPRQPPQTREKVLALYGFVLGPSELPVRVLLDHANHRLGSSSVGKPSGKVLVGTALYKDIRRPAWIEEFVGHGGVLHILSTAMLAELKDIASEDADD